MKKIITSLLVVALLAALATTAYAAPMRAASTNQSLSFSGTTANCEVTVSEFNKQIVVTMSLWDGKTCIASWSDSGKSIVSMSKSCAVESGKSYTLQVSGTSGGSSISVPSITRTCPG